MKIIILLFVIITFCCSFLYATIINIPADQPTIQAGIDVAVQGDIVLVQPGTYIENINYNGKNITVGSLFYTTQDTSYISQTVIDGNQNGSVVTFESGEDSTAILCGFTITNGTGTYASFIPGDGFLGGGIYCNSSTPTLYGLIIENNNISGTYCSGGGLAFLNNADVYLSNSIIINNSCNGSGGGVYCEFSDPSIENTEILSNTALYSGGGMSFEHSSPQIYYSNISDNNLTEYTTSGGGILFNSCPNPIISNTVITRNIAIGQNAAWGGGIYCDDSGPTIINTTLSENISNSGGGAFFNDSNPTIINSTLSENKSVYGQGGGAFFDDSNSIITNVNIISNYSNGSGGGFYFIDSNSSLSNVRIVDNLSTGRGGGLHFYGNCNTTFDDINRCNIYLNYAAEAGNDIYSSVSVNVIVDTFTVPSPNYYYSYPIDLINLAQQHSKIIPVDQDLYVSPTGSDNNSGLTPDEPLQTISYALALIQESTSNDNTIYLSDGLYSHSITGERYPLNCKSHISIIGENEESTILDGNLLSSLLYCISDTVIMVSSITFKNGQGNDRGGGINIKESEVNFERIIVKDNSAKLGGGIYSSNSEMILNYALIHDNYNNEMNGCGGGIYIHGNSQNIIKNSTISNNIAISYGGGIYIWDSNPIILNTIISDNLGTYGIYTYSANPTITYSGFHNNEGGNFYGVNDSIGVNVTTNANGDSCDVFYNIQMDPFFVNPSEDNYHLLPNSPCINAGDPSSGFDPDGTIVDIGAYYYPFTGIQGTVTLGAGFSNIIDVIISANGYSTNPDSLGIYQLILDAPGFYDVTASLPQYNDSTYVDVEVLEGQVTQNIDFTLYPTSQVQLLLPLDAVGVPGAEVLIPLFLENPDNVSIEGIEACVTFNEDILDCTGVTLSGGFLENEDYFIQSNTNTNGEVSFWIYATGNPTNGEGILANLEFTVSSTAQNNDFSLLEFTQAELNDLPISTINGLFTVNGELYNISGNITYFSNYFPIQGAFINLDGNVIYNEITDVNGNYLFDEVYYGNYISSANKNNDLGGLSPIDASRIARNSVGLFDFDCYEYIAADVTLNNYITSTDASRVARYGLGIIDTLNTNNLQWVFVADSINNFVNWPPIDYESTKNYSPLNSNLSDEDFVGIRLGDVSGNWEPTNDKIVVRDVFKYNNPSKDTRKITTRKKPYKEYRDDPSAFLPEIITIPDTLISIPLIVEDLINLEGMDIIIEFEPDVIIPIGATLNGGIFENEDYGFQVNTEIAGCILLSFYAMDSLFTGGGVVAYLEFEVVGDLGDVSPLTFTQFVINEFNYIDNVTNGSVSISETGASMDIVFSPSLSNYPNPFNPTTTIEFSIQNDSQVELSIYNIKGQKIITLAQTNYSKGNHSVVWDCVDDENESVSSGLYFFKLNVNGKTEAVKKCLLLK